MSNAEFISYLSRPDPQKLELAEDMLGDFSTPVRRVLERQLGIVKEIHELLVQKKFRDAKETLSFANTLGALEPQLAENLGKYIEEIAPSKKKRKSA